MILLRDGKVLTVFEEKSIHLNSIILTVVLGYLEHGQGWKQGNRLGSYQSISIREQTLPGGVREGVGMDWEFGVSRYKLLHLEWRNNKVLLYSTENYIQSPGIAHDA